MRERPNLARKSALYVVVFGLCFGIYFLKMLWTLDDRGLSIISARSPFWDFTNFWGGASLALKGRVADLFDVDLYRQDLRALISPALPDQEWSYPPSLLLLGLPFASLPLLPAYLVWTLATLLLFYLSLRLLDLPPWIRLLLVVSPAAFINVVFGQNGALTAALLLSGLLLVPSRPLVAGILLGLLTIKPQIGLLVPFCLLASGNYRTIVAAAATAILLVLLTAGIFSWESWSLFLSKTRPMMTAILEAPYPQGFQKNGMTFFLLSRSLGLTVSASYIVQALFSLAGVVAAYWLWRPSHRIDHPTRVCLTALLTFVVTPYGYVYDALPLDVAAALFFWRRREPTLLLGIAWLYPLINHVVTHWLPLVGILVPAALTGWTLVNVWRDQRAGIGATTDAETATASAAPPAR